MPTSCGDEVLLQLTRVFLARACITARAIYFKRNVLSSTFIQHKLLTRDEFDKWALAFLMFGNAYIEQRKARLGNTLALKRAPAKSVRRRIDLQRFV